MDKQLPEMGELIQLDFIRKERNKDRGCVCKDARYIVNEENMTVFCQVCDNRVEPIHALIKMATIDQRRNEVMQKLYAQAKDLDMYKPFLKIIKFLEKQWRRKETLPRCPSCHEPFYLEELQTQSWIGRKWGDAMIALRKERTKGE